MDAVNTPDVLNLVFNVFDGVSTWFVGFVNNLTAMFMVHNESDQWSLTFFGILALVGLSISVIFLIIGLISNFLHFRG